MVSALTITDTFKPDKLPPAELIMKRNRGIQFEQTNGIGWIVKWSNVLPGMVRRKRRGSVNPSAGLHLGVKKYIKQSHAAPYNLLFREK